MFPHVITGNTIMFMIAGDVFNVSDDHPYFHEILAMLNGGVDTDAAADQLRSMADKREAVSIASGGSVKLGADGAVLVDGEAMPEAWTEAITADPKLATILTVKIGDQVRIEGDEDAPDGVYTVADLDNDDTGKRLYVESDEEGFFGFVDNAAFKGVVQ